MIVPATPENVDRGAQYLREGRLVAFPTETVYGLGADARNVEAVRQMFAVKRRPADHPLRRCERTLLLAHCGWPTDASYAHMIPDTVAVIAAFLDGKPINVENK